MSRTKDTRKTEAPEFSAFVRRIMRAMGRRAANGDLESLRAMMELRNELDAIMGDAARAANAAGQSWTTIGAEVGMSRQAARQRWAA